MTDEHPSPAEPPSSIAVVVDCNCFLQLRDLKDLAWRDLYPGVERVEIMVTPSVVAELDIKKVDSKDRIRNRARAAIKLLDAASEGDPMRIVVRADEPVVAINLPEIAPTNWAKYPRLDASRPDDALVAQAFDLETNLPKFFLSHDSGPRMAARRLGLSAKNVPDTWLLPDPIDDHRKQLQKLQRENELLRARHPQIQAGWGSAKDPLTQLTVQRLLVPPLSSTAVAAAVALCRAQRPHAVGTMKIGSGFLIGEDDTSGRFDQDDYLRYVKKWEQWAIALPAFFDEIPKRIADVTRFARADLWFENAGNATAERLTIDFGVSDGWDVLADQKAVEEISPFPIKLPTGPLTPFQQDHRDRAAKADDVSRQARLLVRQPPPPRDPTEFEWIERPHFGSKRARYGCDEFRAKRRYEDAIWIWPRDTAPIDGKITVDIHGTNLGEPIELGLPINFVERKVPWGDSYVAALLDPPLAEIIASAIASETDADV